MVPRPDVACVLLRLLLQLRSTLCVVVAASAPVSLLSSTAANDANNNEECVVVQGGSLNDGRCTYTASACCQVPTCAAGPQVQGVSMCGSGTSLTSSATIGIGTTLVVVSHDAGANYRNNSDCRLSISQGGSVPVGWLLRLRFQYFYTESGWDSLTIFDGPDMSQSSPVVFRDSGDIGSAPNARLPELNMTRTSAYLVFTTDTSVTRPNGFALSADLVPYAPAPAVFLPFDDGSLTDRGTLQLNMSVRLEGRGLMSYAADRFGAAGRALNLTAGGYLTSGRVTGLAAGSSARTIAFWASFSCTGFGSMVALNWGTRSTGQRCFAIVCISGSMTMLGGEYSDAFFNTDFAGAAAWRHIVLVHTGSRALLYVNGTAFGPSQSFGGGAWNTPATTSLIVGRTVLDGNPGGGQQEYYYGLLDEIAIWNSALSAAQIDLLYRASAQPTSAPTPSPSPSTSASASMVSCCTPRFLRRASALQRAIIVIG